MAEGYVVNTELLRQAAKQLQNSISQMRDAVGAVEKAMDSARAMRAPRVSAHVEEWNSIKSNFDKIFPQAEQASSVITKTAAAVDDVMSRS